MKRNFNMQMRFLSSTFESRVYDGLFQLYHGRTPDDDKLRLKSNQDKNGFVLSLFEDTNLCAIHTKRITVESGVSFEGIGFVDVY